MQVKWFLSLVIDTIKKYLRKIFSSAFKCGGWPATPKNATVTFNFQDVISLSLSVQIQARQKKRQTCK